MSTTTPPAVVEPYPGWAQEDNRALILGVGGTMIGLASLFVAARIYSRFISIGRLAIDDYIVVFCSVVGIAYFTLTAVATSYGFGRHMAVLPPADVQQAMKYLIISFEPGIVLFSMPKFAVVILLVKILHPGPRHLVILWTVSIAFAVLMVGNMVVNLAQCTPAAAQWGGAKGVCWNRRVVIDYSIAFAALSAMFDFYLAIYPTVVMCRLMLNWKKKLALSSALGFGYCAGAIGVYKAYTLSVPPLRIVDFTYDVDNIVLWTSIEATCVLIGACIPCLYPLVKKLFGARALGGTTSEAAQHATPATIGGGTPLRRKRAKVSVGTAGTSAIATVDEAEDDLEGNSRGIRLDDGLRPFDEAHQWATGAVEELELQQQRVERETV